jgi:hypothetical protein
MDDDYFEESRTNESMEDIERLRSRLAPDTPPSLRRVRRQPITGPFTTPDRLSNGTGIVWIRASELLSTGSGRIAGRGIDFERELARRTRRTPAAARRAISQRAVRLPPLSAFGRSSNSAPIERDGLDRG